MQQGHFEVVCDNCGGLTIVLRNEADAVPPPVLKRGCCGSSRGTRRAVRCNTPRTRHVKAIRDTIATMNRHGENCEDNPSFAPLG
jgi:hypothetical protein